MDVEFYMPTSSGSITSAMMTNSVFVDQTKAQQKDPNRNKPFTLIAVEKVLLAMQAFNTAIAWY
jgi:hypothetical protein